MLIFSSKGDVMKRFNSILWFGASSLLLIFLLAACGSPDAPVVEIEEVAVEEVEEEMEEMAEEPEMEEVVLELYHDKPAWAENTDAMGALAQDSVGVSFETIRNEDPTTFQATIRASLGTDQAPDLHSWWSGYRMADLVASGVAADLTDVWQPYLDSGEYSQDIADAFTFDGKIYGAPFNSALWVVYYNKALFEENGLEAPTTWEEFEALNDELLALGVDPMAQTFVDRWQSFYHLPRDGS